MSSVLAEIQIGDPLLEEGAQRGYVGGAGEIDIAAPGQVPEHVEEEVDNDASADLACHVERQESAAFLIGSRLR